MLKIKSIESNQNLLLQMANVVSVKEKEEYSAINLYDIVSFSILTAKNNIEEAVSRKDFKVETLYENDDMYANCILDGIESISRTTEELVRNSMRSEYFESLIMSYVKESLLRSTMYYIKDSFSILSSNEAKEAIYNLISIKLDYMLDGFNMSIGFYDGISVTIDIMNNLLMSDKYRKTIPLLYNPYDSDNCKNIKFAYNNCIFKNADAYFYIYSLEKCTSHHDYLVSDFIIRRVFGYGISELNRFCY